MYMIIGITIYTYMELMMYLKSDKLKLKRQEKEQQYCRNTW